jgi:putative hydrolase of the HAD superfamily
MDIKVNETIAVIFDLDDTLYNEVEFLKSAFKSIASLLEKSSYKTLYATMFSLYRSNQDVFAFLNEKYGVDKDYLLKLYHEHEPDIQPFDGVIEIIQKIRDLNGSIGIITDGRRLTQMNKIHALGVGEYIDHVVISEELGSEKPERRNFEHMMNALKAEDYYYIGDNLRKDFVTPNLLGWKTIGLIDNGLNIHKDAYLFMERKFMPESFVNNLGEIVIMS